MAGWRSSVAHVLREERGADPSVHPLQIARIPVETYKPHLDDRYADTEVVSHSSLKVEAIPVETAAQLLRRVEDSTRVIGVDEARSSTTASSKWSSSLPRPGNR